MNKMSDINCAASVSYYSCVKALETMKMLVFGNLLLRLTVFPFFVLEGKQERDSWGIEFPVSIIFDELGPWSSASSVCASQP